jgi:hypothetical protein
MILNPRDVFIGLCAAIVVNLITARLFGKWDWSHLGYGLLGTILVYHLAGYGTRWEFGPRYHMPKALVAPDGLHFLDGTQIPEVNLAAIRNDRDEELSLFILAGIVVIFITYACMLYRTYREELHKLKLEIIAGLIRKAEDKRDCQEAEYLRDRYAETVTTGRTTWPRVRRRPDLYGELPDSPYGDAETG